MPRAHFSHVDTWVFDLDNTLYPPEVRLFDQIEARMTAYVMKALGVARDVADTLRKDYWRRHGTTLAGLMREHGLDPDPYLADVHEIDLSAIKACGKLKTAIDALPGRRLVYTNGSREHARRVIAALGLTQVFEAAFGVEDAGYAPKPEAEAFTRVFALADITPETSAMFEDDPRNLAYPYSLGMRTVLVGPGGPGGHIHHQTGDLADFLTRLV